MSDRNVKSSIAYDCSSHAPQNATTESDLSIPAGSIVELVRMAGLGADAHAVNLQDPEERVADPGDHEGGEVDGDLADGQGSDLVFLSPS